ncbi:MAG: ROK family protein, partial [Novosphingobium sp.]
FFDAHPPIAAFGVASFGPLDVDPGSPTYGTFGTTPKPNWPGASWLEGLVRFGAPVEIDTDVNGAALGEWAQGAGRGCTTLAYVTVGTGIGAGVVRDGRPLSGFSHYEMGHIRPPRDRVADPYAGGCPSHGDCLEGLASGPAILARWGRDLSDLADRPEALALIGGYLGHFAATLALTHMPDRVVFGGGVMKAPGLIQAIRAAALNELGGYVAGPFAPGRIATTIVPPALGDDAGIVGAIELGRRALAEASSQQRTTSRLS